MRAVFLIILITAIVAQNIKQEKHCIIVDASLRKLDVINIFTFLDPSWLSTDEQLYRLKGLAEDLQDSKIPEISFFVIMKQPDANIIAESFDTLRNIIPQNFTIIEDNEKLQIWNKFNATRNHVFVINKCGLLRHRFSVGWGVPKLEQMEYAILRANQKSCNCTSPSVPYSNISISNLKLSPDKAEVDGEKETNTYGDKSVAAHIIYSTTIYISLILYLML